MMSKEELKSSLSINAIRKVKVVGMNTSSRAINCVFTEKVLADLVLRNANEVFDCVAHKYLPECEGKKVGNLYSEMYNYLYSDQRNEYFYQNTLLNRLLLARHDPATTVAFRQLRVAMSIADFVMINGEGRVYEIKSDLDNFHRLAGQLNDYYTAFSKVCVVVPQSQFYKVENEVDAIPGFGKHVGIYSMTKRGAISRKLVREPEKYDANLQHDALFGLLHKPEYQCVLHEYFHEVPDEPPIFYYKACQKQFRLIPILQAQKLTLKQLKKRNNWFPGKLDEVQSELKSVLYFAHAKFNSDALRATLTAPYRGGLVCTTHISEDVNQNSLL